MGKFKQMQIDIDDENVAKVDEEYFKEYVKYLAKTQPICEHEVKIAFTRKVFVSYCKYCGKIFDVVKR